MEKVILTGGTGFVGANLARKLVESGHAVHLLLRENYQSWRIETIRDELNCHIVDLADVESLTKVIKLIQPDWIFHLAAHGAYSWQQDFAAMVQTNIVSTANLVNVCLKTGFEVFINTGSSSEYGYKSHPPTEDTILEPNSHYALTKASATHFCQYTAREHKVFIPTLRLYSVYGSYESPNRLLPTLITKGLENTLPPLVNPKIARDFIYVDDVYEAYIRVATTKHQSFDAVYNVGTGVQTSIEETVYLAKRIMGISVDPEWGTMADRLWDTTTWVSDNRKLQKATSWKPQYTFEQGFQQMVDWFRAHPELHSYYEG